MGLFWYDRYKAIAEAIINLVVSIILVEKLGVAGVFLGTLCSTVLTSIWVEPYILYKYRFGKTPALFFLKYVLYIAIIFASWFITDYCCNLIHLTPFANLIIYLVICVFVFNILLFIIYQQTPEFRELLRLIKKIFNKIIHRGH